MAELIAVNDMLSIVDFASFKREALMFDRIAFPNLRKAIDRLLEQHREVTQPIVNELDWLQEVKTSYLRIKSIRNSMSFTGNTLQSWIRSMESQWRT